MRRRNKYAGYYAGQGCHLYAPIKALSLPLDHGIIACAVDIDTGTQAKR